MRLQLSKRLKFKFVTSVSIDDIGGPPFKKWAGVKLDVGNAFWNWKLILKVEILYRRYVAKKGSQLIEGQNRRAHSFPKTIKVMRGGMNRHSILSAKQNTALVWTSLKNKRISSSNSFFAPTKLVALSDQNCCGILFVHINWCWPYKKATAERPLMRFKCIALLAMQIKTQILYFTFKRMISSIRRSAIMCSIRWCFVRKHMTHFYMTHCLRANRPILGSNYAEKSARTSM